MSKSVFHTMIKALAVFAAAIGVFGIIFWDNLNPENKPLMDVGKDIVESVLPAVAAPIAENTETSATLPVAAPAVENIKVPVLPPVVAPTAETTQDTAAPAIIAPTAESIGTPTRIRISSIGLDASIEKVGLTADGFLDVPGDPFDTGWYALGPRPGEIGSAVIDGHVDWLNGVDAVFANLHRVKPGDLVAVQDDQGKIITFVVREIVMYEAAADAVKVFRSNDGEAHLNLITCYGEWDKDTEQYTKRLVVFTDRQK